MLQIGQEDPCFSTSSRLMKLLTKCILDKQEDSAKVRRVFSHAWGLLLGTPQVSTCYTIYASLCHASISFIHNHHSMSS